MFPSKDDQFFNSLGTLDDVPHNVSYLGNCPNEVRDLVSIDFNWYKSSQHLRITNYLTAIYYEDYLMTSSHSKKTLALQLAQATKLSSLCAVDDGQSRSFVDIGCGDGSFLSFAKNEFDQVTGIEPSKVFADIASNAGYNVINSYVSAKEAVTDAKFDAFTSRQVFEHLEDPLDVLVGIKNMLNPGAVGLIEVPNGYKAFREARFYEFFPDHVNYYSVNSLVALATNVGFNVIECKESFGSDYLELWVRNDLDQYAWFANVVDTRNRSIKLLKEWIDQFDKKIGLWGCGAKGLCIIQKGLSKSKLECVIDSDVNKVGRYIPNTDFKVKSPEEAALLGLDAIFIMALSYSDEIKDEIRKVLPTCRTILTFDDRGNIIEI